MYSRKLIVIFICISTLFLAGCESAVEARKREQAEKIVKKEMDEKKVKSCIVKYKDNVDMSCVSDPKYAYCALNYEQHEILGSGCTSRISNAGSYSEQVQLCKTKSYAGASRACDIEVYGCTAVTGLINC